MSSGGFPCWNFLTAGICVSTPGISFRVRFYRHQAGRKLLLLLLLRSRFSLTLTWHVQSTTAQVYAQG